MIMRNHLLAFLCATVLAGSAYAVPVGGSRDSIRDITGGTTFVGGPITADTTIADDIKMCYGDTTCDWWHVYNSGSTQFELQHTSIDGGGTDRAVLVGIDGTDNLWMPRDDAQLCWGAVANDACMYWTGAAWTVDLGGTVVLSASTTQINVAGDVAVTTTRAPRLIQEACSTTNPNVNSSGGDFDTGQGCNTGGDGFSIIAGGVNMMQCDEDTIDTCAMGTNVYFDFGYTAGITASVTQSQGNGALVSSVNEISTVATEDDTVTMPAAAPGRFVSITHNGANRMQIFPASGDDVGKGADAATTMEPGDAHIWIAYDATNWQLFGDHVHGEMFDYQNADAFTINAQTNPHCYHTNGVQTDASSLGGGWTQDDGGGGTSHAITAVADAGGGDITVTTGTSHNLAIGDIVSQTNLADAAYEGIFEVLTVPTGTSYTVTAVYTATDTGTTDQCAYLLAPTGADGHYNVEWEATGTNGTNNQNFDFWIYVDSTVVSKTEVRRKFATAGDYGSLGGGGFIDIDGGQQVVFVVSNVDGTGTITLRNFNLRVHKL